MTAPSHLISKLAFETPFGTLLGDAGIRLLEAIERHGSLTRAARDVPLSYKAAWDTLDRMNNLADQPLVERTTGGQHGGGTKLTDYGRKMMALYRAMEKEHQEALDRLSEKLHEVEGGDVQQFRTLMKRLSVKTSARNQFAGTIVGLRRGDTAFEVRMRLDAGTEIIAAITPESAENMGLRIGMEAFALIKAPWVRVVTRRPARDPLCNVIAGTVTQLREGPVNTEVILSTAEGRHIAAVMPSTNVRVMAGQNAYAMFDANSIILAVYA